jgi:hypothetical protein
MAMGTSVFRIRIELIFRRCWNLITPWGRSAQREIPRPRALMAASRPRELSDQEFRALVDTLGEEREYLRGYVQGIIDVWALR